MTSTLAFDGVLFFPVTPFDHSGSVDLGLLSEHVGAGLEHAPGAVFPACGTGEFHALSSAEAEVVAKRTVDTVAQRAPVLAGVGGSVAQATELARAYESVGVDGLLLLPPYLVSGTPTGLEAYVRAVVTATSLPVVIYHRGTAKYSAASVRRLVAEFDTIVGFKDGIGDVALAQEIVAAASEVRSGLHFFNGLLTAELSQAAYRGIGIPLYSSSTFAMAPAIASAHYDAYMANDEERRMGFIREFYAPLVRLRDKVPGYGVSLVKAGVRMRGLPVGPVRAPLVDLTPEHEAELARLLEAGERLVSESAS